MTRRTTGRERLKRYIPEGTSNETLMIIVIVAEHVLLFTKFGLQKIVPDKPKWVHEAMEGNDVLRMRALRTTLDVSKEKKESVAFERRRLALIQHWQASSGSDGGCDDMGDVRSKSTVTFASLDTPTSDGHGHSHGGSADSGVSKQTTLGIRLRKLGLPVETTRYD